MMGRRDRDQASLFYDFNLDDVIPTSHLLRRLNVFVTMVLADLRAQLQPFYSDIGRPSVDPELTLRMLIVGYCTASATNVSFVKRSSCTWPIAGSASSTSAGINRKALALDQTLSHARRDYALEHVTLWRPCQPLSR